MRATLPKHEACPPRHWSIPPHESLRQSRPNARSVGPAHQLPASRPVTGSRAAQLHMADEDAAACAFGVPPLEDPALRTYLPWEVVYHSVAGTSEGEETRRLVLDPLTGFFRECNSSGPLSRIWVLDPGAPLVGESALAACTVRGRHRHAAQWPCCASESVPRVLRGGSGREASLFVCEQRKARCAEAWAPGGCRAASLPRPPPSPFRCLVMCVWQPRGRDVAPALTLESFVIAPRAGGAHRRL